MYSAAAQRSVDRKVCSLCGQPLPLPEKYGIRIDTLGVEYNGKSIRLPPYKLVIFETLLSASPEPVTKKRMFELLYTEPVKPQVRPLDALMHQLRSKLKNSGLEIETVYGIGWRLVPPPGALGALE